MRAREVQVDDAFAIGAHRNDERRRSGAVPAEQPGEALKPLAATVFIIGINLGLRDNYCRVLSDLDVPVIIKYLVIGLVCRAYAK